MRRGTRLVVGSLDQVRVSGGDTQPDAALQAERLHHVVHHTLPIMRQWEQRVAFLDAADRLKFDH